MFSRRACALALLFGPFGETTVHIDPGSGTVWLNGNDTTAATTVSGYGNPYMYTARRFDDESGLYYYRNRHYSPGIKRFVQPDPIGYADGMNIYAYCGNNPVNFVDPMGLFRFGNRPLNNPVGKFLWYGKNMNLLKDLNPVNWLSNATNLGLYHEHGFFEDGTGQNVGFFGNDEFGNPQGVLISTNDQSETPSLFGYEISPWQYDDDLMRQALQNVMDSGDFDPEDYKLMGSGKNNCQDFASALKKEYKRLGGKSRYRPFGRRDNF